MPMGAMALAVLSGCAQRALDEQKVTFTTPHAAAGGAGAGVDVEAHNGAVTIERGGESEVTIVATLRMQGEDRLGATQVTATRDAQRTLVVRAEPPEGWKNREGVSFAITIPEAAGVRVVTSNGRITIAGLAGDADLRTGNGAVRVVRHDGAVKARTSNGAVDGEGITGPVDARTSNGAVEIALSDENAGPVKLRTSNGAVRLEVGPAFAGDLEVETSNGSINVPESSGGMEIRRLKRGRASLRFGEGEASGIETSNGSVRVVRR